MSARRVVVGVFDVGGGKVVRRVDGGVGVRCHGVLSSIDDRCSNKASLYRNAVAA